MEAKSIYRYTLNREKISEVADGIYMTQPEKVAEFLRAIGLASQEQEHLVALIMNPKNMVVGYYTVVIGLVDTAYVHSRELFRQAIIMNATGLVMAHNHPSQHCEPSHDDVRITSHMKEAGDIIGIKLLDHIIVSETSYFSFREKNMI